MYEHSYVCVPMGFTADVSIAHPSENAKPSSPVRISCAQLFLTPVLLFYLDPLLLSCPLCSLPFPPPLTLLPSSHLLSSSSVPSQISLLCRLPCQAGWPWPPLGSLPPNVDAFAVLFPVYIFGSLHSQLSLRKIMY